MCQLCDANRIRYVNEKKTDAYRELKYQMLSPSEIPPIMHDLESYEEAVELCMAFSPEDASYIIACMTKPGARKMMVSMLGIKDTVPQFHGVYTEGASMERSIRELEGLKNAGMPIDDEELAELIKQHTNLELTLSTYEYVMKILKLRPGVTDLAYSCQQGCAGRNSWMESDITRNICKDDKYVLEW